MISAGGPDDPCAAAEITCDGADVIVNAIIRVERLAEKVESCGRCAACPQPGGKAVPV